MRYSAAAVLLSGLMAIAAAPAHADDTLPRFDPNAEAVEIPVPPPANAEPIVLEEPAARPALNPELRSALVTIFSSGLEQALSGEAVEVPPGITGMVTESVVGEFERIANKDGAPNGVAAFARALRAATQGAPTDQVTQEIKAAFQAILDSI